MRIAGPFRPTCCLAVLLVTLNVVAPAQNTPAIHPRTWTTAAAIAEEPPAAPRAPAAPSGCRAETTTQLSDDTTRIAHSIRELPHSLIKPHNLKWEIPIGVAAAVLITSADTHVSNNVRNGNVNDAADLASNVGLGAELGAAGFAFLSGCAKGNDTRRGAGFSALESAGYSIIGTEALKLLTNRERPNKPNGDGGFWDGGKSFPSGHATISWAVASALAHQYPHRWVKWTAYGTAIGISALRIAARQHFPSDVLVGGTVGYVTGASVARH